MFRGLGDRPDIRQLYMDEHRLLRAALCLPLTAQQQKALFAAFALSGIHITRPAPGRPVSKPAVRGEEPDEPNAA